MADPGFQCDACGRRFRWKPALAGKRVACRCGEAITVPAQVPPPRDASASGYELADPAAAAASPQAPPPKCVQCNAKLKPGTVICIGCGTDQRTGKQQTTATLPPDEGVAETVDAAVEAQRPAAVTGHVPRNDGSDDERDPYQGGGMVALEVGLWAALLAIGVSAVSFVMLFVQAFTGDDLQAWIDLAAIASSVLNLAAFVLMLFVPRAAGARWLLFTALGCVVVSIVAAAFTEGIWDTSFTGLGLALLSSVLSFLAVVFFLLFLKQLAEFFEFGEVTEKADRVVGLYIVLVVGQFAICIPFVGLLLLALGVVVFWLYVSLLIDLYRAAHYLRTHGAPRG